MRAGQSRRKKDRFSDQLDLRLTEHLRGSANCEEGCQALQVRIQKRRPFDYRCRQLLCACLRIILWAPEERGQDDALPAARCFEDFHLALGDPVMHRAPTHASEFHRLLDVYRCVGVV